MTAVGSWATTGLYMPRNTTHTQTSPSLCVFLATCLFCDMMLLLHFSLVSPQVGNLRCVSSYFPHSSTENRTVGRRPQRHRPARQFAVLLPAACLCPRAAEGTKNDKKKTVMRTAHPPAPRNWGSPSPRGPPATAPSENMGRKKKLCACIRPALHFLLSALRYAMSLQRPIAAELTR